MLLYAMKICNTIYGLHFSFVDFCELDKQYGNSCQCRCRIIKETVTRLGTGPSTNMDRLVAAGPLCCPLARRR